MSMVTWSRQARLLAQVFSCCVVKDGHCLCPKTGAGLLVAGQGSIGNLLPCLKTVDHSSFRAPNVRPLLPCNKNSVSLKEAREVR